MPLVRGFELCVKEVCEVYLVCGVSVCGVLDPTTFIGHSSARVGIILGLT